MKRLFAIALTILLLSAMPFDLSVFAASGTYDLDELGLKVTIPDGYSVITRDTPASDPVFSDFGLTKAEVISQFKSSSIYLNAISNTYNEEVVVTMVENNISNLSSLSDTELDALASALPNTYITYGITISKYDIYQHSQAKFIRLYFKDLGESVHGLQYYTIYNGKAMNFTLRSYEGSISSRQETAIKAIVDSIKYDTAPPVAAPGEDTDSFIYKDTDSGVTFTVPANWKQEAFTKDREFLDVKFASTKERSCTIIYGSTDMWSKMSASDKAGHTRSDIDNSSVTKSDVAEIYNTTADKISMVTYNGVEYFKGEPNYTSDEYGSDITVKSTQLVYINNGWMYLFQFGGTSTHKLYADFESLLQSVKYPAVSSSSGTAVPDVSGVGSTNSPAPSHSNNDSDNTSDIIALIVVLVIIAIIIVAVVIYRKKNSETANYTPNYNTPTPAPPSNPEPTICCPQCGRALPSDSDFCHMCGAKTDRNR